MSRSPWLTIYRRTNETADRVNSLKLLANYIHFAEGANDCSLMCCILKMSTVIYCMQVRPRGATEPAR